MAEKDQIILQKEMHSYHYTVIVDISAMYILSGCTCIICTYCVFPHIGKYDPNCLVHKGKEKY